MSDNETSRAERTQTISTLRERMMTIEQTITRLLAGAAGPGDPVAEATARRALVLAPARVGMRHRRWM